MKKEYKNPQVVIYEVTPGCRLLSGSGIPVDPSKEGHQNDAEGKTATDVVFDDEETDDSCRYEIKALDFLPRSFHKDTWR